MVEKRGVQLESNEYKCKECSAKLLISGKNSVCQLNVCGVGGLTLSRQQAECISRRVICNLQLAIIKKRKKGKTLL